MRVFDGTALLAVVAVGLAVASAPVHARGAAGPCRQDMQRLCPNITPGPGHFRDCLRTLCPEVTPGPGAFGECLKQHQAQLSPACKQRLSDLAANMAAWQEACHADVQSFCGDVTVGHGNIIKCLRQHRDELSPSCKQQLAERRRWWREHKPTPVPGNASNAS